MSPFGSFRRKVCSRARSAGAFPPRNRRSDHAGLSLQHLADPRTAERIQIRADLTSQLLHPQVARDVLRLAEQTPCAIRVAPSIVSGAY